MNEMIQPPDTSGGSGFTFEDASVALYLGALLGERSAPGLENRIVTRVAVQQRNQGEPLDDLIVDGIALDDSAARLSLQVKRAFTIGAGNADFREVASRAWATLAMPDFREDIDRVGAVTGTVDDARRRDLGDISAWARASASAESFLARFKPRAAGKKRRDMLDTFRTVLSSEVPEEMVAESLYRLLRHFTLLKFDLLHEGATDQAHAIERLRPQLRHGTEAEALWDRLRVIAREGAGTAREFDREALLFALGGRFRLAGAPSIRHALACVGEETRNALASIPVDVDGIVIGRSTLLDQARDVSSRHRFVHVIGLPGTGKSSVLRQFAESLLNQGTTLVLKSDRLVGPNWTAHARSLGINAVALDTLLAEIAATGNPVLFIDGLDRIEIQDRGIVLDLVNTILASPALAAWKIVATSRDNGIEPLRTWLPPEIVREGGVGTVAVEPFDDTEAAELAEQKPALLPLLFGNERVREIARRPFFAAVLARSLEHAKPGQAALNPKSSSLKRGGSAAAGMTRMKRSSITGSERSSRLLKSALRRWAGALASTGSIYRRSAN